MFKPVAVEKNFENLKYVANKLLNIEWFIFFGTLLGYTRENNIIKNDDDIDIYINLDFREDVIKTFKNTDLLIDLSKPPNLSQFFLQGIRKLDGEITYVDFYFFENMPNWSYIEEKHNFSGKSYLNTNAMHIPKQIIYPIRPVKMKELDIFVPNKVEDCCQFLYGKDWKKPMSKSKDYIIDIINHRPMLIKKNNFNFTKYL